MECAYYFASLNGIAIKVEQVQRRVKSSDRPPNATVSHRRLQVAVGRLDSNPKKWNRHC